MVLSKSHDKTHHPVLPLPFGSVNAGNYLVAMTTPSSAITLAQRPRRRCATCNDLDYRDHPDTHGKDNLRLDIKSGSFKDGCEYCQLLKSMVLHFAQCEPSSVIATITDGQPSRIECIIASSEENDPDLPPRWIEFYFYSENESEALPKLGIRKPYLQNTDLETSFNFMNDELQRCLREHKECPGLEDKPLPTRVLSIGASDQDIIRLVEAKGKHAQYITLSHCWGTKQPFKTTRDNLTDMTVSIGSEALPIVFQQAISIARRLKVAYIWIDSLCIVQDDQQDWELESTRMCDYYENSFLTISTASSSDSDVPFLRQRDEKWWPSKFEILRTDGRQADIYARRIPGTPEEEGILFTRAWAWQEAALSARTIHFTPSELIWGCWHHVLAQHYVPDLAFSDRLRFSTILYTLRNGFQGDDSSHYDSQNMIAKGKPDSDESSSTDSTDSSYIEDDWKNYVWQMWDDLVGVYSSRQLSFATDKLPALSGVASRVHAQTSCRYVAGLWEENLEANLCWTVDGLASVLEYQPATYVAPSWSRASITQAVEPQIERTIQRLESKFTVLDVFTEVPGLNPFGSVSRGHLVLSGMVAEVELVSENPFAGRGYSVKDLEKSGDEWTLDTDCVLTLTEGKVYRAEKDQKVSKFKVKTPCLYLGVARFDELGLDGEVHYIMILGSSKDDEGSFCRLGLASAESTDLFENALERELRIV
ncbi:heterokaryon incompatibility protein-domain-containing protein [Xylariales sp. AK1849]|nr:heterokaryon incompatibility protein-domain-containing protein [Xylariales sp. AK1849]